MIETHRSSHDDPDIDTTHLVKIHDRHKVLKIKSFTTDKIVFILQTRVENLEWTGEIKKYHPNRNLGFKIDSKNKLNK